MVGFIGRRHELERLQTMLDEAKLVTLLGTEGTGKTRLAHEVAQRLTPAPAIVDDGLPRDLAHLDALRRRGPVLVVSRDVVGLPGEQVLPLGPLPRDDARRLWLELVPEAADDPCTDEVLALTDGLPKALTLVARAARLWPLAEVVADLDRAIAAVRDTGARLPRSATMAIVRDWWDRCRTTRHCSTA
jgi:predicted ATPase